MPNWCNNNISISHSDPAILADLAEAVKAGNFLKHIIPVPEDLNIEASYGTKDEDLQAKYEANREKHGHATWYDYCVAKWGTKWDVEPYDPEEVKVEDGRIEFGFDSAWAPPVGVYEAMVEMGYDVIATYYEPGMCFVGKWDNGDDACYDYSGENSKTVRDSIGEELDDLYGISESMAEYEEEEAMEEDLYRFTVEGAEKKGLNKLKTVDE